VKKVVVPGIFLAALSSPLFIDEVKAASNNVKIVDVDTGSKLNVRVGPSTSSSTIMSLSKGKEVTIISESNGWSEIKVNGKNGYVSSKYLISKQTSTSSEKSIKYVSIDANSSLNVRKSPSSQSNVLTKLSNNTKVEVYAESNGWSKIKVNGIDGYVASQYIKESKSSAVQKEAKDTSSTVKKETTNTSASNSSKETKTVTKYVNVSSGSSLNLRTKPSTTSSVIVKLAKDVSVTVISESNGWSKIKVYGKEGYVSTTYLSTKKTTSTTATNKTSTSKPASTVSEEKQVVKYVNVDQNSTLNVRKSASTTSSVLTKLKSNTKVTVLSDKNGWSKIKVNNIEGYVSSQYLVKKTTSNKNESSKNDTKNQTDTKEQIKDNKDSVLSVEKVVNIEANSSLNVRSTPSTSGKIVDKLKANQIVTVLSESNGWSKIKVNNKEGYVSSQYLKVKATKNEEEIKNETDKSKDVEDKKDLKEKVVNINANSNLNVRANASTSSKVLTKLSSGTVVTVISESNGWSKIKVNNVEGYVSSEYLAEKVSNISDSVSEKNYTNYHLTLDEMTNIQLKANPQTDKQYDTYIREDAVAFKSADSTKATVLGSGWRLRGGAGTDFSVVSTLSSGQVLTVTSKVKGTDGYYWYKVNYNKSWVTASKEDTAYYINPNNFIDNSLESLQFLNLAKKANVNDGEVNKNILAGKGILAGKASSFITAANAYGINEIYLISHALLETGNGTSTLANGVKVNGKTVYNMYGIGAYDGTAISSGAEYAYNAGWFTPEAAIIGGAQFIAQGYIKSGQDTLYKMRWNPEAAQNSGVATHQYATDIAWASKQVKQISNLYSLLSSYTLNYDIPVYKK